MFIFVFNQQFWVLYVLDMALTRARRFCNNIVKLRIETIQYKYR